MFYYSYIFVGITSFVVCLGLTPFLIKCGKQFNMVSESDDPEIKRPAVPDTGGIAILLALLVALVIGYLSFEPLFHDYKSPLIGLGLGTIIIGLLGFIDDRKELSVGIKLSIQIAAALIAVIFGAKITKITNPAGHPFHLGYLSIPITILWIVGITNAVNMTDGMDGLAPGVLAIGTFAIFVISVYVGFPLLAIIMIALFGSTIAFLYFNYPPAKIILGNVGAYTLGFIVATATIIQPVKATAFVVLFVPLLALGLPVLEMTITVFRRIARKKKIYLRDTEHLHHILLALGLPPQIVDWIFYCLSFLFAAVAVGIATGQSWLLFGFVFLLLLAFIVLSFKLHTYTNNKEGN